MDVQTFVEGNIERHRSFVGCCLIRLDPNLTVLYGPPPQFGVCLFGSQ